VLGISGAIGGTFDFVAPRDIEGLSSLPLPSCVHIAMWPFCNLRWLKKMKTRGPFGMRSA
jgi:hypothetical protein